MCLYLIVVPLMAGQVELKVTAAAAALKRTPDSEAALALAKAWAVRPDRPAVVCAWHEGAEVLWIDAGRAVSVQIREGLMIFSPPAEATSGTLMAGHRRTDAIGTIDWPSDSCVIHHVPVPEK